MARRTEGAKVNTVHSPRTRSVQSEIDPEELGNPILSFVRDYWQSKRAGRVMPSRGDIKPAEMKEYLGWIILIDVLPGFDDFRFRMIGTRVSQYFLADATGQTMREAFAAYGDAVVNGILATHRKTARDQVVVRAYGGAGWLGRSFLDFDAIYLPLSDDGVVANMILSAFTFDAAALIKARAGNIVLG
jgi:hypothetical protein